MDITSIVYFAFVVLSLIIYWIIPKNVQWIVLLAASLIFYFTNVKAYTFLYLLTSVVSVWLATRYFKTSNNDRKKRVVLVLTVFINIGMLVVLKYTNLLLNTISFFAERACGTTISTVEWVASLGISFYTLQIVSYLLDAYWGVTEIQRNPLKLLLFTSYFPLMVSGPINTHENLGHQLFEEHKFDYNRVTNGMKRIAWGLVKKLAISNRLALVVNTLWNNLEMYNGIWVWIAVLGYVFQLYTDFSGCMDIVLGVSECFGIKLLENFQAPLYSRNIQEFWQRWHITLGQWLRDYIMNPLLKSNIMISIGDKSKKKWGKKKGKKVPVYLSMLVLWLAMGLWHGNSWKYIIGEGVWFWLVIVLGQIFKDKFLKLKEVLGIRDGVCWTVFQVVRTNLIFAVGMLFFRASSLMDSFNRLRNSIGFHINGTKIKNLLVETLYPIGKEGCLILGISFIMLCIYDFYLYNGVDLIDKMSKRNILFRWGVYFLIIGMILLSYNAGGEKFAYAQF